MPKNLSRLIISIAICQAAGVIGSFFTVSSIPTWYQLLTKPGFSPPDFIFGPVWLSLYTLMGISLYLAWQKGKIPKVFWFQLALNAAWSILFFGLKSPLLGLIGIVALLVLIILTIKEFWKINKLAGVLLLPYLAWVSFATILNFFIWFLNR